MRRSIRGVGILSAGVALVAAMAATAAEPAERGMLGVRLWRDFRAVMKVHGEPTRRVPGLALKPSGQGMPGGVNMTGGGATGPAGMPMMGGMAGPGGAMGPAGMPGMGGAMGPAGMPMMGGMASSGGMTGPMGMMGGGRGRNPMGSMTGPGSMGMIGPGGPPTGGMRGLAGPGGMTGPTGMMGGGRGGMVGGESDTDESMGGLKGMPSMGSMGMMGGSPTGAPGFSASASSGASHVPDADVAQTWVYERGPHTFMFMFNKDGRVIKIQSTGAKGTGATSRGIALGSSVTSVYKAYGWAGTTVQPGPGELVMDYTQKAHVVFDLQDTTGKKGLKVVGITIAPSEGGGR